MTQEDTVLKNFFKKETEADKILAEIKNSEFKKTSMIGAVLNEKNTLLAKKNSLFLEIGEHVYTNFLEGKTEYEFESFFTQITELISDMETKETKISELTVRYDEEISLLQSSLSMLEAQAQQPQAPVPAAPAPTAGPACGNCNAPITPGDAFCESCGTKL